MTSVADPGFFREGGGATPKVQVNVLFVQIFPKRHLNEENWTEKLAGVQNFTK